MTSITVREYARLTTDNVITTLDQATVSASAFDWLCNLNAQFTAGGTSLVQVENRQWLRLDNYVGVVETPCGTRLEILPKHVDHADDAEWARGLLHKMVQTALDLPTREVGAANINLFKSPLTEWVIWQFLQSLDHLVKRGIRFDYQRVEEEQRFLRGQLNVTKQMRQAPGRQQFFQIRHDVFLPDRPENRLLKAALNRVCKYTQEPDNWRLAHELASFLAEIPTSKQVSDDFRLWRKDRLMAHYQMVKPWCELILGEQMPLALKGDWHGISLLFPMEKLFERFVAAHLRRVLSHDAHLTTQAASQYLCNHLEKGFFQLRPDMLVRHGKRGWVMDAKWKRLNELDRDKNYGVSQSDFYQLFAYGQKYLDARGNLLLIYPKTANFSTALPVFKFSDQLVLWVIPFDLENMDLILPNEIALPLKLSQLKCSTTNPINIKNRAINFTVVMT